MAGQFVYPKFLKDHPDVYPKFLKDHPDNPLVCANTQFSLDMMRTVTKKLKSDDNIFFSPFAISACLAMTSLGAKGNTAAEMKSGLRFPSTVADDDLHSSFNGLISTINSPDNPYSLSTANRIYTRLGKDFKEEFLLATRKHYTAETKAVNFQGDPDGVKKEINDWVEEQTAHNIKNLIPDIDPNVAMILVNAIYFKGNWAEKFDPVETTKKPFNIDKETKVDTDFMFIEEDFHIGSNEELDCRLLGLPYEKEDLSFFLLVPNKTDGLAKIEEKLTCDHLTMLHSKFRTMKTEVKVFIPKFKMERKIQLNDVLAAMGMKEMFCYGDADFSGMDGTHEMYVDQILHKAYIDVNEEGTEAAAATGWSYNGVMEQQTVVADRPFLFFIRDNRNGSVLFMGRYCKPPQ